MKALPPALLLTILLSALAFGQDRKPVAGHLDELPSLDVTKAQALDHLEDYKNLKLRDSLTPGIENWWAHTDGQQIVYSLKCVKEKIIAISFEIPGIVPEQNPELMAKRTVFTMRALANADKLGGWDKAEGAGQLGRWIGEVTSPPYEAIGHKSGDNFIMIQYFPKRNAVQISILPLRLIREYDLDGI